jgi:hypothetical protein
MNSVFVLINRIVKYRPYRAIFLTESTCSSERRPASLNLWRNIHVPHRIAEFMKRGHHRCREHDGSSRGIVHLQLGLVVCSLKYASNSLLLGLCGITDWWCLSRERISLSKPQCILEHILFDEGIVPHSSSILMFRLMVLNCLKFVRNLSFGWEFQTV